MLKDINPFMNLTRRSFLGQANCALISSLPILNTLLNLRCAGDLAAAGPPDSEYRAVVCLFLNGGCDSYNMLVPTDATEYAEYATIRQDLALPVDTLLPINPTNTGGKKFGLHPGMPELQALFENGNAAFVSNVGTLIERVTKAQYNAKSKPLPLGLFSHSDQIEQWQTSLPHARSGKGWAGRTADLLRGLNGNQTVSMNISLSGSNTWQSGNSVYEYAISDTGATKLSGYKKNWVQETGYDQARSAAVDGILAMDYQNLLQKAFAKAERTSLDGYDLFSTATSAALPGTTVFPTSTLGKQLQMVAKTVNGRDALGVKRQTFFVSYGGWDHHDDLLTSQQAMLPVVSQAVGAFYSALVAMGIQNQVTLYLASDFGRTLTSNGQGTDHAWGGNSFVVGGAVAGKQIYGQFPQLAAGAALDTGRGRLIPSVSVDEYFAELALWLGVSRGSLPLVLPNIGNFWATNSASGPLGMLPI